MRGLWIASVFLTIVGVGGAALRADDFAISAGGSLPGGDPWVPEFGSYQDQGLIPVAAEDLTMGDDTGSILFSMAAEAGTVKVSETGQTTAMFLEQHHFNPHVRATAQGALTVTGPGPTVDAAINIQLTGFAIHFDESGAFQLAETQVEFRLGILSVFGDTFDFVGGVYNGDAEVRVNEFASVDFAQGISSLSLNGIARTRPITFQTGVPTTLSFRLTVTNQNVSNGFPGVSQWNADFSHTASFAQSGPVFDLPEGYTVNGFGIVNNRFMPGDYNNNGSVDAADYVVWRKNLGASVTLPNDTTPGSVTAADYTEWRAHFGQTGGSGAGVSANAAVPEPAASVLLIFAAVSLCVRRAGIS